ncbi:MAG: tRNA (adenosine(37)-N6)-threonylcarbamoyltransferase complex ATPase subunit type 1 TsaE, partial [Ignavibacteria bacterium]
MNRREFLSNSPEETFQIAKNFSKELKPGDIVALNGNLGTGKTIFVKGICAGLNA